MAQLAEDRSDVCPDTSTGSAIAGDAEWPARWEISYLATESDVERALSLCRRLTGDAERAVRAVPGRSGGRVS